ncbi:MAG TPA: TolC family protein [Polyangiaceae bacterium]|nr:TolC family protein [Polyangiaceae bacterium]
MVTRSPTRRTRRSPAALCFALASLAPLPASALGVGGDEGAAPGGAPAHRLLRDSKSLSAWLSERSPDVRAARAQAHQAQAEARGARLLQNPVLDASLNDVPVSKTSPAGLGYRGTAIYGVGLSETFELGKRGPRSAAADLRARAAGLDTSNTLSERIAVARDALGRAVHLGLRLGVLAESLADAEHAATIERTRLEQKALSGMDYDRLLLDLAGLRADFARDEAEYTAARADCAAALAAECDLTGANEDDLLLLAPADAVHAEERLAERPDVRSLGMQAAAAEHDATLASNKAIPDVTVRVGYTHDQFLGDNPNTLGFSLALPLPVFDHGQHDAAKAKAHAVELGAEKQALLEEARADVRGLLSRKAALEKNIEVLERDTLPRSSGVLSSAERAFHEGGASLTDLLLARRNHIALSLTRLDQRFELFEVQNELYRVLGLYPVAPEGKP